jgi:hypothetical protein
LRSMGAGRVIELDHVALPTNYIQDLAQRGRADFYVNTIHPSSLQTKQLCYDSFDILQILYNRLNLLDLLPYSEKIDWRGVGHYVIHSRYVQHVCFISASLPCETPCAILSLTLLR